MNPIHTIPVGGNEPMHIASPECWCHPLEVESGLYAHNAEDCREKLERQGVKQSGNFWVLVMSHI